jgi:hypothetical protein
MKPEFVPDKQLISARQLAHSSLKVFYHLPNQYQRTLHFSCGARSMALSALLNPAKNIQVPNDEKNML